jgi:arsenate reductase-like glutaredoxin family protein
MARLKRVHSNESVTDDVSSKEKKGMLEEYGVPKKLHGKVAKFMSFDRIQEVLKMSQPELEELIAGAAVQVQRGEEELEAHEEYQRAVEAKKLLESGLKEAIAPYKATIQMAAFVLSEKQKTEEQG